MRLETRQRLWAVVIVVLVFSAGIRVGRAQGASQPVSCWDAYERFLSQNWNALEACIADTNPFGYGRRLLIRTQCNARWVSNALQAEADYLGCMSLGKLAGLR